ncbi:MAG: hypothetical protein JWN79_2933, partial [Gemmatimonadetes bacterium]|nr:hypothetical protein [Gemmatimonadota bacterium]
MRRPATPPARLHARLAATVPASRVPLARPSARNDSVRVST